MKDGDAHVGSVLRSFFPFRRPDRPLVALVLAAVAFAAGLLLAIRLQQEFGVWWLTGTAVLASVGIFTLVGVATGVVHFGNVPKQRAFFDGLADAIDDAFV